MKPISIIKADLGIEPNGRIHKFFTNTCARHMDKYVPFRDGSGSHLRQYKIEGTDIKYEKPYAHYQYKGMREDGTHRVTHYTTPGTGPYWDKRMWSAEKNRVIQEVQDEIKRSGGK